MKFNFTKSLFATDSNKVAKDFISLINKLSDEDLDKLQYDIANQLMKKDKSNIETGDFDETLPLPLIANLKIPNNIEVPASSPNLTDLQKMVEEMLFCQRETNKRIETLENQLSGVSKKVESGVVKIIENDIPAIFSNKDYSNNTPVHNSQFH